MKKAFVLSGGSIKGAFQAGALADLLTSNSFQPDLIYGTSVGSLNGAFIADRAGKAAVSGASPDWVDIGNELQRFWLENIDSFEKVGKKRGSIELFFSLISNNFKSFLDMSPLYNLIKKEISIENLRKSPVKFYACAVNLIKGDPVYASVDTHSNMHDYIIASTAIPLVMPVKQINNKPYVDGGIREVAPLRQAIDDDATSIISIVCQPRKLHEKKIKVGNVVALMECDMDIVTNETVNNDLDHCDQINEILKYYPGQPTSGPLKDKRHINLLVIRPTKPVDLDLEDFNEKQIRQALEQGRHTSQQARKNCDWLNQ